MKMDRWDHCPNLIQMNLLHQHRRLVPRLKYCCHRQARMMNQNVLAFSFADKLQLPTKQIFFSGYWRVRL